MELIFGAFAMLEGYREGDRANRGAAAYYRCIVVALASAKGQNPSCTVALVTNAAVPAPFDAQLAAAGVEIWRCPYDTYRFGADTPWALAFYKLCALEWVLQKETYDRLLMLDVDTVSQRPYTDIWREAGEAVLLYQVPHAASQTMAAAISADYDRLCPEGAPHTLTHFGGEFVCGSRQRLTAFLALCRQVYREMTAIGLTPQEGDEAIWCAAAYRSLRAGQPVRAANAYIFRYWLGGRFYYVSTNYCLDPVCILHLPGAAKERQFRLLYRYYARRGQLPPAKTIHRWCCLPAARPPLLRTLWVRLRAGVLGS